MEDIKLCACGCGRNLLIRPWHKYQPTTYLQGHGRKGRKSSPEHILKITLANRNGEYKNCKSCNSSFWCPISQLDKIKYCSKDCYTKSQIGISPPKEVSLKARQTRIKNAKILGYYHSKETREKIRLSKIGDKNGAWKEITLDKIKRAIRNRDNQICMLCGIHKEKLPTVLDVHHIDYNPNNHLPVNLISLCHPCHCMTNKSKREFWTQHFQAILNSKYNYQYNQEEEIIIDLDSKLKTLKL